MATVDAETKVESNIASEAPKNALVAVANGDLIPLSAHADDRGNQCGQYFGAGFLQSTHGSNHLKRAIFLLVFIFRCFLLTEELFWAKKLPAQIGGANQCRKFIVLDIDYLLGQKCVFIISPQ